MVTKPHVGDILLLIPGAKKQSPVSCHVKAANILGLLCHCRTDGPQEKEVS